MIFDTGQRSFAGPASRMMTHFDYLNESARPEAEQVRQLLESWMLHYPETERAELISRFRDRNDVNHVSATFELMLHELFRSNGARLTVHPQLGNKRARPDFLVETANDARFYLEATLVFEDSGDEAAEKRLAQLYDIIDQIECPDYFIAVKPRGIANAPLPANRIRRALEKWLAGLDYNGIRDAREHGNYDVAEFTINENGVELTFSAWPKKNRDKVDARAIGGIMPEARWIAPRNAVRRRLIDKSSRYGALDLPMIVAVNVFSLSVEREDIIDALFGTEGSIITRTPAGFSGVRPYRAPDGVWQDQSGPRYTRLSAVFWTAGLTSWNLASRALELIHNPWATHPVGDLRISISRVDVDQGKLRPTAGRPLGELLGLSEDWPRRP